MNERVCMAFDRTAIFDRFIVLCRDFTLAIPNGGHRLTASQLATALERHIRPVKSFSRFQTVQVGMETIGAWTWFGSIVIQHGTVLEVMFEGQNNGASAGSTLYDMRNTALDLRSAPGRGPPYVRPGYNGDRERLDQMAARLADLIEAMKASIRQL